MSASWSRFREVREAWRERRQTLDAGPLELPRER